MDYRPLGRTGLVVSSLCLGTMTFGAESDEPTAYALLDRFVEAGGTFIDTADVYAAGVSESMIGRWLANRPGMRDRVVLATKGRFPMGDGPLDAGLSRAYLSRALDASLRRLGVEAVDLYQAHGWDPLTPVEETLRFYDDAVRAGKIRAAGVSNFLGWQVQRAVLTARHHGWTPVATLQPQYNLLAREIEWEVLPVCVEEGVAVLPWSPLGGGWLTGKYARDARPEGATRLGEDPARGVEAYDKRNTERTWRVLDAVQRVAEGRGVTMAQVALSWVIDRPAVASTALGARSLRQLEDNLGAAGLHLGPDETAGLDAASAPPTPDYPYGLFADMTAERARFPTG